MAEEIRANAKEILAENQKDMEAGKVGGLDAALLDRLEHEGENAEADPLRLEVLDAASQGLVRVPD